MYAWCYALPDTPHDLASNAQNGSSYSGLLRWLVVCGAAPLASCHQTGILDPQGPIASQERLLLINSTAIMLVVVVPVILATLAFAWWYRSSNLRASRGSDEAYEGRLEFVLWSIPALIVILLGGVIWIGSHQLDPRAPLPADAEPLRVEVVALDWKWLFIYPDQRIAAVNQLVIPAGTPVRFRLTSATVMNSFFIPQLGSQIYAMSGMTTHLNLLADRPGEYRRRRLFRYAVHRQGGADRRFRQLGRHGARHRLRARRCRLCRISETEPGRATDNLSLGRAEAVRTHHRPDGVGSRRSRRRGLVSAGAAGGRLRCWAS